MGRDSSVTILNLNLKDNSWLPQSIDEYAIAQEAKAFPYKEDCKEYLYVIQIEPYIDSLYIRYGEDWKPIFTKRFCFHEGYAWSYEEEQFFSKQCVRNENCLCHADSIDEIFEVYSAKHPEWHLKRYYTKGVRILDHIYHCIHKNTAKEILYKANLDELAVQIDEIDELNLLASKPQDIYEGLPNKVLRAVNCKEGARLVADGFNRRFLKDLNIHFPDIFAHKLNDAQCGYLSYLIRKDSTVGEAGRSFRTRQKVFAQMWTSTQLELMISKEKQKVDILKMAKEISEIDPVYADYLKKTREELDLYELYMLKDYLIVKRKDFDRKMARANRKREYDWQERGDQYLVRYPQTINDFCREAIYMGNCLLIYTQDVLENKTTILFMRKSSDYNHPFITIEVRDNTLIQAYHRFNSDCTRDEAKWIRDYCKRHGIDIGKFSFFREADILL